MCVNPLALPVAQEENVREIEIDSYRPTARQKMFHRARTRHRLYGGAMGGGKSRALCEGAVMDCMHYPGNFVFIGRKTLVDFMASTYRTLTQKSTMRSLLEHKLVSENRAQQVFTFWNGSMLFYSGIESSDSSGREKVFSTEYGSIFIDEAWEISQKDFMKLGSRLRHTLPEGSGPCAGINSQGRRQPPYHISMASNPAQNWIKEQFITAPTADETFIRALPGDNPYNPDDYEAVLRRNFGSDEKMLRAYVEGSWDSVCAIDDLFSYDELRAGCAAEISRTGQRKVISCDPGRFGDDMTVIYCWRDEEVVRRVAFGRKDTMEVVGWLMSLLAQMGAGTRVIVDETGTGAGIVDRLRENAVDVTGINFASRADEPERFVNKRAEMFWHARDMVRARNVRVPDEEKLISQLAAVKYRFHSNGRILLESKEELKKRLGRSPDEADCFVLGLEALRHCPAVPEQCNVRPSHWAAGGRDGQTSGEYFD